MDKSHDVALLRLHDTSKASTFHAVASFCKRPDVTVGDYVTSMGYPLSLGFVTSFGRVAKTNFKDADGTTVFLADLTVAPGNSGGPVIDSDGYVAGMAEAIVVMPLSMVSSTVIHLSFIIPRSVICADIASGGSVD
jgi:S1-C subfamily serine protease